MSKDNEAGECCFNCKYSTDATEILSIAGEYKDEENIYCSKHLALRDKLDWCPRYRNQLKENTNEQI